MIKIKLILLFVILLSLQIQNQHYFNYSQMATTMANSFPAPTITAEQLLRDMNKNNVLILDTRELNEYTISHIKGAIHVGYNNFNIANTLKIIHSNSIVILYCSVGYRSADISARLINKGIKAYNLYGGIFNWKNSHNNFHSTSASITNNIHGFTENCSKWITHGEIIF